MQSREQYNMTTIAEIDNEDNCEDAQIGEEAPDSKINIDQEILAQISAADMIKLRNGMKESLKQVRKDIE